MDLLLLGPGGIGAQKPVNEESFAMLHIGIVFKYIPQFGCSPWPEN